MAINKDPYYEEELSGWIYSSLIDELKNDPEVIKGKCDLKESKINHLTLEVKLFFITILFIVKFRKYNK